MEIALIIVFGLIGAAIGSFLNVMADRLPEGQSIVFPASHCPACQRRLSPLELIPVASYIVLRGRCRTCGARIPPRVLLVEMATGLAFALLLWYYAPGAEFAIAAFYFCIFELLVVTDVERGLLPNIVVYPAAAFALAASIALSGLVSIVPDVLSAITGGLIGLGVFFLIAVVSRGGMGWGDVKMAALVGLVTGFPLVFVALLAAVVAGGVIASLLIAFKIRNRKQTIPFGPFLSIAAVVTLIWGTPILHWYLGLLK